jgi:uncharacterized protein YkwD
MSRPKISPPLNKTIYIPFVIWLVSTSLFVSLLIFGEYVTFVTPSFMAHLFWGSMALAASSFMTVWIVGIVQLFKPELRKSSLLYLISTVVIVALILIVLAILSSTQLGETYRIARLTKSATQESLMPGIEFTDVVLSAPMSSVQPSPVPSPTLKPKPIDPYANDPHLKDAEWGKAVEVATSTYRMKVQQDPVMTTVDELYQALNAYRQIKGKKELKWNDGLAEFARERISEIPSETVAHQGFKEKLDGPEYFEKYGMRALGENASQGYRMTGTHLIEWLYAGDSGHDTNQLGEWSHVGIAVEGRDSVLIFGLKN